MPSTSLISKYSVTEARSMNSFNMPSKIEEEMLLPRELEESFAHPTEYPENQYGISTSSSRMILAALATRLDESSLQLFVQSQNEVEIPFREFYTCNGKSKSSDHAGN
jgi:hypothetical protein